MRLVTDRLLLVACPLELAEALQGDRERAETLLGASLPDGWPDEELLGLLPLYSAQLNSHPETLGFGVWILVEQASGAVVGSAGFIGQPRKGVVELGYGVHPASRNAGYATEAARALVAWALTQAGVTEVVSECERANAASVRVLEKVGLRRTGVDGSKIRWSLSENA